MLNKEKSINDAIIRKLIPYLKTRLQLSQEILQNKLLDEDKKAIDFDKFMTTYNSFETFIRRIDDLDNNIRIELVDNRNLYGLKYSKYVKLTEKDINELMSFLIEFFENYGIYTINQIACSSNENVFVNKVLGKLYEKYSLKESKSTVELKKLSKIKTWMRFIGMYNGSAFHNTIQGRIKLGYDDIFSIHTHDYLSFCSINKSGLDTAPELIDENICLAHNIYLCKLNNKHHNSEENQYTYIMLEKIIDGNYFYKRLDINDFDKLYPLIPTKKIIGSNYRKDGCKNVYSFNELKSIGEYVEPICRFNEFLKAKGMESYIKACYNQFEFEEIIDKIVQTENRNSLKKRM